MTGDLYAHCDKWERGRDCKFNSWHFYTASAIVWGLTLIPLFLKAAERAWKAPSGASTLCVLLTAISGSFTFLDNVLFLVNGEMHAGAYHLHMLTFIGSMFLVFGLSLFAGLWCNVASALHSKVIHPILPQAVLRVIRQGYLIIAITHIPFALLKAVADIKEDLGLGMIRRDQISAIWALWSFVSSCTALTIFSILMVRVAWRIGDAPRSKGFRAVTWVNFIEQMFYDVFLGVIGFLYFYGSGFNDHGHIQAVFFTLYFLLHWSMHAQVLVFFSVVEKDDPLYSKANDVVGRSELVYVPRQKPPSPVEEISFSWEGGGDIDTLIEELKTGVRKLDPSFLGIANTKLSPEQLEILRERFAKDMVYEGEDDEPIAVANCKAGPLNNDLEAGHLSDPQEAGSTVERSQTVSTVESPNQSELNSFDEGQDEYTEGDEYEQEDYDVEYVGDDEEYYDEEDEAYDQTFFNEFASQDSDTDDRVPESPCNADAVYKSARRGRRSSPTNRARELRNH